jgi:hypothetical protein
MKQTGLHNKHMFKRSFEHIFTQIFRHMLKQVFKHFCTYKSTLIFLHTMTRLMFKHIITSIFHVIDHVYNYDFTFTLLKPNLDSFNPTTKCAYVNTMYARFCCHSPTQPQLELELDLIMGKNPPTTPPELLRHFQAS